MAFLEETEVEPDDGGNQGGRLAQEAAQEGVGWGALGCGECGCGERVDAVDGCGARDCVDCDGAARSAKALKGYLSA